MSKMKIHIIKTLIGLPIVSFLGYMTIHYMILDNKEKFFIFLIATGTISFLGIIFENLIEVKNEKTLH